MTTLDGTDMSKLRQKMIRIRARLERPEKEQRAHDGEAIQR